MASENLTFRVPTHAGLETKGDVSRFLRHGPEELRDYGKPALGVGRAANFVQMLKYHPEPYNTDTFTATYASGTAASGAAGLVLTTHSDAGDEACFTSTRTRLLATDEIWSASAKFAVTTNSDTKFLFGFGTTTATTPLTTAPADGVYLWTSSAGVLLGGVVEPTDGIKNTATLATMTDAEEIEAGLVFSIGTLSDATLWGWGYFWVLDSGTLTKTLFTASQIHGLFHMVTTSAPTMAAMMSAKSAAGSGVLTSKYIDAGVLL